jgi:hypothetical protein
MDSNHTVGRGTDLAEDDFQRGESDGRWTRKAFSWRGGSVDVAGNRLARHRVTAGKAVIGARRVGAGVVF